MAWTSKEELVMDVVLNRMKRMSTPRKDTLTKYYSKIFFRHEQQEGWRDVRWTTRGGVTFVTMWDEEHLYNNLRLAMIKEMMGIGPMKYCILNNAMPHFESRLLLLIYYLPHKKMCFYPPRESLSGPFTHPPWLGIGEAIRGRTLNLKNPLIRTIYYTQQFVVFTKTGFYGPSYWL